MTENKVAPYGVWKSPITSELIVSGTIGLGQIVLDGDDIYWAEGRPSEGGRNAIVHCTANSQISDVIPNPFNARTRVHEYGGGAFLVANGTVYFSNFADQHIYQKRSAEDSPYPLTTLDGDRRYADSIFDRFRERLICICEDHTQGGEPINSIVSINYQDGEDVEVLVSGSDFYSTPRLSPDGKKLAWLSWNHPNMPWDGTELWVADFISEPDQPAQLGNLQLVAGGASESIFQPEWSPDGILYFVSDRPNWWNLYRWQNHRIEPLYPMEAEFGLPQWVFGMSTYAFVSASRIICTYTQAGEWYLATLDLDAEQGQATLNLIPTPYTEITSLKANGNHAVFIAGSPTMFSAIIQMHLTTYESRVLQSSSDLAIESSYLSQPQAIAFPTEQSQTAYGFFYPPTNRDYIAPEHEKPPLLVKSHGGPTAATSSNLSLKTQYWTSRGFAVLDVNYGGSTGYGRDYRQRLQRNWGIVDVDDCTNGAKYLAASGLVDGDRLTISGGSAGGYTTLCALTFRDVFKAGASYYGVSDLEALAKDTHKFESRYLDGLIGAYPEQQDLYRERSPINYTNRLSCPVIFFQGLEDQVVPPNQTEMMVEMLRHKGLPVAYVLFEGEQHGFRKAENIKRCLDGEFYFYAKVFGFADLPDAIEPVIIENL